jgi:hypothetical protein
MTADPPAASLGELRRHLVDARRQAANMAATKVMVVSIDDLLDEIDFLQGNTRSNTLVPPAGPRAVP